MQLKSDIQKTFKFEKFFFSAYKCEIVQKLTDKENLLSKEEVFKILKNNPNTDYIVDLCINHPSIYLSDLTEFIKDMDSDLPHECIIDSVLKREKGYGEIINLFIFMDINKIYNELYQNIGKPTEYSQDTILGLSSIYLMRQWENLSQEFACLFAHNKHQEYIEERVLENNDFLSNIDNSTKERVFSAIASNINLSDDFRNKIFDMDCNYDMIKSPTEYMKKEIYLNVAETLFDVEDNGDDLELYNLKVGAQKRIELMIKKGLTEEFEIDLINRIKKKPYISYDDKKLLLSIFTKTHSAETLKMAKFFKDLSIQDSAYLNPCMPDYLIRDRGQDVIDKFCESVKKFGNKPNKHLAKIVLAGLDAGIYTMNNYNKLISCNLMPVLLCIAKSKHTPKPILLKISQNTNDEKLKDIININIAMQKHKLNTTQRKHIENLIEDVEKFGRSYIKIVP